jgi:uncharacterized membrane protein
MKIAVFPYLAVALGILLMLIVIQGSSGGAEGSAAIPLLTLLVISEFAFFVTGIGVYIGIKHFRNVSRKPVYIGATIICALLAAGFLWMGFELWPL